MRARRCRRAGAATSPQEDDAVRQMLLSYRNYRRALWEIIHRHKAYARRDMRDCVYEDSSSVTAQRSRCTAGRCA